MGKTTNLSDIIASKMTMDQVIAEHCLMVLAHHNNNRTHAAEALGICIRTLRNNLKAAEKLGYDVPQAQYGNTAQARKKPNLIVSAKDPLDRYRRPKY